MTADDIDAVVETQGGRLLTRDTAIVTVIKWGLTAHVSDLDILRVLLALDVNPIERNAAMQAEVARIRHRAGREAARQAEAWQRR